MCVFVLSSSIYVFILLLRLMVTFSRSFAVSFRTEHVLRSLLSGALGVSCTIYLPHGVCGILCCLASLVCEICAFNYKFKCPIIYNEIKKTVTNSFTNRLLCRESWDRIRARTSEFCGIYAGNLL